MSINALSLAKLKVFILLSTTVPCIMAVNHKCISNSKKKICFISTVEKISIHLVLDNRGSLKLVLK